MKMTTTARITAAVLTAGLLATAAATEAATIWTGPRITFSKASADDPRLPASQDRMTPQVWITRASTQGIYNAQSEAGYDDASPADTEWAYGTTAALPSLTFKPWVEWNGKNPPITVGTDAVVHLISDDIYIDIKFTAWGQRVGSFAYQRSTPSAGPPPPATTTVFEFYHPGFDHYFITAVQEEAANLAAGKLPPWVATGMTFKVWSDADTNITNVWRFFSASFAPKSGHFYTNNASEAASLQAGNVWSLEDPKAFYMMASPTGTCPSGTIPLYRLYNNGQGGSPNHRYTIDLALRATMIAAGWIPEGNGAAGVFTCVPA